VLTALFPHHVVGDLSSRCFAWPLGESDRETNVSVVDGEEVRRCDDEGDMMCNSGWDTRAGLGCNPSWTTHFSLNFLTGIANPKLKAPFSPGSGNQD
jgi:hypothetical protein